MKTDSSTVCYCESKQVDPYMLQCEKCKRSFHFGCLQEGKPSTLEGDIFFRMMCCQCGEGGIEKVTRIKLQWLQVVMLSLYNLQLKKSGNKGYFRWKEHICDFIDKNWSCFFGLSRRKTHTWYGTVAGTLSSGCPQYFQSGTPDLGENGWWKLKENKPPSLDTLQQKASKRYKPEAKDTTPMKIEGLRNRRNKPSSIQAAMELKAKRDTLQESKDIRKAQKLQINHKPGTPSSTISTPVSIDTANFQFFGSSPENRMKQESMSEMSSPVMDYSSLDQSRCSSRQANLSFDMTSEMTDQSSQMSFNSCKSETWYGPASDLIPSATLPNVLMKDDEEEEDIDFEIDPCALSPDPYPPQGSGSLPRMEEILSSLEGKRLDTGTTDGAFASVQHNQNFFVQSVNVHGSVVVKQEVEDSGFHDQGHDRASLGSHASVKLHSPSNHTSTNTSAIESPRIDSAASAIQTVVKSEPGLTPPMSRGVKVKDSLMSKLECSDESDHENGVSQTAETSGACEPHKRRKRKAELEPPQPAKPKHNYVPISLYEEKQTLKQLKSLGSVVDKSPKARRLRRKLMMRQVKRERSLQVFDLDSMMNKFTGTRRELYGIHNTTEDLSRFNPHNLPTTHLPRDDVRILDRFQNTHVRQQQSQPVSFLNRLVGTEDDQLQSIKSPYTARVLKPFIRRDYETQPLKMKLLLEIQSHYRKKHPDAGEPVIAPIDYCYVRPQHIPSVNALCRQFFWPGIDLSECLQYPDFSCVVLYRKFVIGFAFMVPDVKFNEAYISFLFTHPEWRRAGIARFMLYHLIQTCMGKDVTLHVSASNSAMLLYQNFGFKPEEFIVDFYDKYFPLESKDCRHAFFLRLRR